MKFSIKTLSKSILILFILNVKVTFAQEITEIMYDPIGSNTGKNWIEVYNNTSSSINLSNYIFYEDNVNHRISNPVSSVYINPNGNTLLPGEYAVIVDNVTTFLSTYIGFSGKLFDSSFSLSQSGDTLSLKTISPSVTVFTSNYVSDINANGTGGTLNYINNSWQVYEQTPGAPSTFIPVINNSSTSTKSVTNDNSSNYISYVNSGAGRYTLGDLKILAPKEIDTVVGAETEFFVKNIDSKNSLINANTYWSFGDGSEGIGATTTHRYQNAGIYNAFVETQVSNAYGVDRIRVKVENPNIEISDVQDNYVEIYNKSNLELNIGKFKIVSDQGIYVLSRMFIISPMTKVKIDGRVMGFSKLTNVKLMSAYNTLVTKYENSDSLKDIKIVDGSQKSSTTSESIKSYQKLTVLKSNNKSNNLKVNNANNKEFDNKIKIETKKVKEVDAEPLDKEIVEKGSTNFIKKWLYWIYE
jgi:hypothetical protein